MRRRKCPTIQQKNEWTHKWSYEKDALARAWVNTLCRRGTHWMTLVDPQFISLTTIQVGKRNKDKKERVLLRPTDKEVNHIRCFAIDIAKDLILLSYRLSMEHLCVLQLETALATLVTTWFTLVDRRWRSRNWKSETLAKLFPEPPVVAFRRSKSIKDALVRAAVSRPSSTVGQCKPCGDKRCKCCLQLQHNN
jgi:hypothetical protein